MIKYEPELNDLVPLEEGERLREENARLKALSIEASGLRFGSKSGTAGG